MLIYLEKSVVHFILILLFPLLFFSFFLLRFLSFDSYTYIFASLRFRVLCVDVYVCVCVHVPRFAVLPVVWLLLVQARIRCRASRRLPAYRASDFVFFHVALLFVPDNDLLVHGRLV